jgi:hypothetical protein
MKRLDIIVDFLNEKMKWLYTPLFVFIMITRGLGWGEFSFWDALYCLAYVFIFIEKDL